MRIICKFKFLLQVISATTNEKEQDSISNAQTHPSKFEYNADDYAHNKYSQAANSGYFKVKLVIFVKFTNS